MWSALKNPQLNIYPRRLEKINGLNKVDNFLQGVIATFAFHRRPPPNEDTFHKHWWHFFHVPVSIASKMILIDNAKVTCDSNQRNSNCKSKQRLLMHRIKMKLAFVSIITWEQREIIISFKDDASENNALRKDLKNNSSKVSVCTHFWR